MFSRMNIIFAIVVGTIFCGANNILSMEQNAPDACARFIEAIEENDLGRAQKACNDGAFIGTIDASLSLANNKNPAYIVLSNMEKMRNAALQEIKNGNEIYSIITPLLYKYSQALHILKLIPKEYVYIIQKNKIELKRQLDQLLDSNVLMDEIKKIQPVPDNVVALIKNKWKQTLGLNNVANNQK